MASKQTKLDAVNILISNIGQAPTTTLQTTNPQVNLAELVLDEISSKVQTEGWVFNTEQDYPFTPDAVTAEIVIPDNVLRVDLPWGTEYNVVVRNGKLYDRNEHSFTWNQPQYLNVTWLFDFDELPEAAKEYITIRAANLFAMRATGSMEIAKYSEKEESIARAALMNYECQQGDYNIFSNGADVNPLRTYRPVSTLWRY